ncbi:TPA: hypothetical protein ACGOY4_001799, partial [Streptococcus suis]
KKIDFNIDKLEKYFIQNDINDLLENKLSVIDLPSKDGVRTTRNVESYIDFLVSQRNSIAHSFHPPTGAKYGKEAWLNLLDLFIEIFSSLDNFLQDQLLKKLIDSNSPQIQKITNFALIATKKSNVKTAKIDIQISGSEPDVGSYCIFFKEGSMDNFQDIKKFKVIKKEVNTTQSFDYRLEIEEVYKTGRLKKEDDKLNFAFLNLF